MGIKLTLADNRTAAIPFPASMAVQIGDLLWWDGVNLIAQPAANRADQGSLANNQRDFQGVFLGVAGDQRILAETSVGHDSQRLVYLDGIFDCDCVSQVWEVGDLVGIDRNAAVPANFSQQVNKVTGNPQLAIGVCVQRSSGAATSQTQQIAATKVRARLMSRLMFADVANANRFAALGTGVTNLADGNVTLTVATAANLTMTPTGARTVTLPLESLCAGFELNFANLSASVNVSFNGSAGSAAKGNNVCPGGKNCYLWCDGTNWYSSVSN